MELDRAAVKRVSRLVDQMETSTGITWRRKDDMVAEGLLGLMEASKRYNAQSGTRGWTFAYRRVRGRVLDAMCKMIRDQRRVTSSETVGFRSPRCDGPTNGVSVRPQPVGHSNGLSLQGRSIESTLTERQVSLLIARTLRQLSCRKRKLVVECAMRHRPLIHVAEEMEISRGRATRLLAQAILEMRWELTQGGYSLDDFV